MLLVVLLGALHYSQGRRTASAGIGLGILFLLFLVLEIVVERKFFHQLWLSIASYTLMISMLVILVSTLGVHVIFELQIPRTSELQCPSNIKQFRG